MNTFHLSIIFLATLSSSAFASVMITAEEVGSDVVLSVTGTVPNPFFTGASTDFLEEVPLPNPDIFPSIGVSNAELRVGNLGGETAIASINLSIVNGPDVPISIGSPGLPRRAADSSAGTGFFYFAPDSLLSFISINESQFLSPTWSFDASNTYLGESIDSLQITRGTYVWELTEEYGTGANRQTVTFEAVPEPSSILLSLTSLGLILRRRR